jgi:hypothetical protein
VSINTSCRSCVFATWDGREQTGCSAGRVELFVKTGTAVEVVTDAGGEGVEPGSERKFFLVKDRVCNLCRQDNSPWAAETPAEERLARARSEVRPKVHAIVHCPPGTTVDRVLETAAALEEQDPPVTAHFVVVPDDKRRLVADPFPQQVVFALRRRFLGTGRLAWNVRVAQAKVGKPAAVDLVVNGLSPADCSHYLVLDAGALPWPTLARDLDAALNDRLERFLFLSPVEQTEEGTQPVVIGPLVQTRLHHHLGGNRPATHDLEDGTEVDATDVAAKAGIYLTGEGGTHLMRRLAELCPPPG